MKIKVSDLIAEFLKKAEIKTVFGIIGSANSHIFDSITKLGYTQIICVHHEQAAAMAMGAYYRASGKLSAAIVTAGAGAANAITGVLSNWADSIPGIIISGQEQSKYIEQYTGLRMYGVQGFDVSNSVDLITKLSETIKYEDDAQDSLENAYYVTRCSRPGPVWLDFPFDIQAKLVEPREWKFKPIALIPGIDCSPMMIGMDIDYIIKQLSEAKRPVIWAGHGVRLSGGRDDFRELVKLLQIPTILTWSGIDLLPDDEPMYFGRAGVTGMRHSNFIVQNCDLLLVIGSRLSLMQTGYDINQFATHAKIIVIDFDIEREKYKHPTDRYDRTMSMDCRAFIGELLRKNKSFNNPEWIDYCNNMKRKFPIMEECHYDYNYVNSYEFLDYFNNALEGREIITTDMGTALLSGHHCLRMQPDNIMFTSLGLGEMGYGLPGAIGAAFACPDRKVICLNCDGGMMMNLQELQTIIHHKLPIKIVVFNNDGYLMIKHTQNLLFKGYRTAVDAKTGVSCPDYSKIGKAFGFDTYRIRSWENMGETVEQFLRGNTPAICEVFMDPEQEFLPKVKGLANADGTITPAPLEEMYPLLQFKDIQEAMIAGVSEKSKTIVR